MQAVGLIDEALSFRRSAATFDPATFGNLVYDSGANPSLPRAVTLSATSPASDIEVWVASRGHQYTPIDLSAGTVAQRYIAGGMSPTFAHVVDVRSTFLTMRLTGAYWPRVSQCVHGYRVNGNECKFHIAGYEYPAVADFTAGNVTGGTLGDATAGSEVFDGTIKRLIVFSPILTGGNRTSFIAAFKAYAAATDLTVQVVCDGDSITAGQNNEENPGASVGWTGGDYTCSYPYHLQQANPSYSVLNHGISGVHLAALKTDAAAAVDPYFSAARFTKNVVVLFAGTNDIQAGTALATVQSDTATYIAARQAVGWKVVIVPMLDRSNFSAGQRADKDTFNAAIGTYGADEVVTLPASLAGNSPWVANPTKWSAFDNIHLSRLGDIDLAPAISTAVAAA